jgi:hypothetical protein
VQGGTRKFDGNYQLSVHDRENMLIRTLSLLFLLGGTACLVSALPVTKKICDLETKHGFAWRWLGGFIVLFLVGYLYYAYRLWFLQSTWRISCCP